MATNSNETMTDEKSMMRTSGHAFASGQLCEDGVALPINSLMASLNRVQELQRTQLENFHRWLKEEEAKAQEEKAQLIAKALEAKDQLIAKVWEDLAKGRPKAEVVDSMAYEQNLICD